MDQLMERKNYRLIFSHDLFVACSPIWSSTRWFATCGTGESGVPKALQRLKEFYFSIILVIDWITISLTNRAS